MSKGYIVKMPGSVPPQSTEIWEGGSHRGTAFAISLFSEIGHSSKTPFLKIGRLSFETLSEERQAAYLREFFVNESGSFKEGMNLLESLDREQIIEMSTLNAEQGAEKMQLAIRMAEMASVRDLEEVIEDE